MPKKKSRYLPWRVSFRGETIAAFQYWPHARLYYREICKLCEGNSLLYEIYSIDPEIKIDDEERTAASNSRPVR